MMRAEASWRAGPPTAGCGAGWLWETDSKMGLGGWLALRTPLLVERWHARQRPAEASLVLNREGGAFCRAQLRAGAGNRMVSAMGSCC